MKRIGMILLTFTLLLSVSGCATVTMNAKGLAQPVVMNGELGPDVGYRTVESITERDRAFWLLGFINIKDPDIRSLLLDANPAADAFVDVEIKTMFRPLDVLITYISLGTVVSRSLVVRASVVEYLD